jgi:hypothetical protein
MKFYIQNGFNKQLIIDSLEKNAVQKMIQGLINIDKDENRYFFFERIFQEFY